jgi:Mg-chelatase subunit ChlI
VGTLDIERAIQKGERHFEPGVLAAANRGLLYIDEVNLLDDHVVDILLDSAAMGVNVVEREGISFSHPARFILVGTMNPEEGDLRPQLLDRFAFSVEIRGILDRAQRVEIMRRNIAFESDPEAFRKHFLPQELELSSRIEQARQLVEYVTFTQRDLLIIADLTSSMEVDGHRSDLVILKAARAQAAFEGRTRITPRDIALAAELALPHRIKAGPFRKSEAGAEMLNTKIADLKMQTTLTPAEEESEEEQPDDEAKKKATL